MQSSLFPDFEVQYITKDHQFFGNIITDRWSKYSVSLGKVSSKDDIKLWLKKYCSDKYFLKATHNSYAYRIQDESGNIQEWKQDDGETGAGNCILRELQRANIINGIIVVTRYFWWVHLNADRFRHVTAASQYVLQHNSTI